jgi:histidinol-phosphatase
VLDPIDGTKQYARGLPVWATLIALERDGEIVAGVRLGSGARPPLVGVAGGGAFLGGRPIRGSMQVAEASKAYVSTTSLRGSRSSPSSPTASPWRANVHGLLAVRPRRGRDGSSRRANTAMNRGTSSRAR